MNKKELILSELLKFELQKYKANITPEKEETLARWNDFLNTSKELNEIESQSDFINDIFGEFLGYAYKVGNRETNIKKESKTEIDGTRPDALLGFFSSSQQQRDPRVIIELKSPKTDLDKKQNRHNDNRTPVEQAFSYVSKYRNIEWVIVSNFKEIRLYKSTYQGRYHSFNISDLANEKKKQNEFSFLLEKDRLFTRELSKSPVFALQERTSIKVGQEIEEEFYIQYQDLRQKIWESLIENNKDKTHGKNFYLYKAQKLIDRIIFIRFCEENGALDVNVLIEAMENKHIQGKYNRLKNLFAAMNEGNPEIPIAAFNGGLFANDEMLDNLTIPDKTINQIVEFYKYDFGSELDVNILGHIFEQSISDLERLSQDAQEERKDKGIFYTPAYITEYIINETIGLWLQERAKGITEAIKAKNSDTIKAEETEQYCEEYANVLKEIKVVDPACGSGAFLVKVFDYLQNKWDELHRIQKENGYEETEYCYKEILQNNIFGVDINPASIGITKLSLWLKTAHHKEPLTTLDSNIKVGNSLIDDKGLASYYYEFEGKYRQEIISLQGSLLDQEGRQKEMEDIRSRAKQSLALNWEEEFPNVFSKTNKNGKGFNIVVGNPPYVRQERLKDIKPALKAKYTTYNGTNDLYVYFFELSYNILNEENGILGFITSNKWMRAKYGKNLRYFLKHKCGLQQIIDFGGQKIFKDATVDSNITIFTKYQNNIGILYVGNTIPIDPRYLMKPKEYKKQQAEEEAKEDSKTEQQKAIDKIIKQGKQEEKEKRNFGIPPHLRPMNITDLSEDIFDANLTYQKQNIKNKIEKVGTPLKDWDVKINYGIKTGYNEAFIISTAKREELLKLCASTDERKRTEQIIKPILRGRDINRYSYKWAGLWLINSHNGYKTDNGTVIPVDIVNDYPAIYKHLLQYEKQCIKRTDKGKHWTNLRNCAYIEDFEKEKIVWQEMTNKPSFTLSIKNEYVSNTAYILVGKRAKYILPIINSCIVNFYMSNVSFALGDTGKRWIKQFVEQIPIPKITEEEQLPFIQKGEEITSLIEQFNKVCDGFLVYLRADFGIESNKKLSSWHNLDDQQFLSEIKKTKVGRELSSKQRADLQQYFLEQQEKACDLQYKIDDISDEIDDMTYKLYGLTEKEISEIQ